MTKNWILLKIGLDSPEHRKKMGEAIWWYIHVINQVEWATGIMTGYTDPGFADEMGMSISWVRKMRRQCIKGGYCTFVQGGKKGGAIAINKWVDPRSKKKQTVTGKTPIYEESVTPVTPKRVQSVTTETPRPQSVTPVTVSAPQSDTQSVSDRTPSNISSRSGDQVKTLPDNIYRIWSEDGGMDLKDKDRDNLADMEETFGLDICREAVRISKGALGKGRLVFNYVWKICESEREKRKPVVVPNLGTMRRHASPS